MAKWLLKSAQTLSSARVRDWPTLPSLNHRISSPFLLHHVVSYLLASQVCCSSLAALALVIESNAEAAESCGGDLVTLITVVYLSLFPEAVAKELVEGREEKGEEEVEGSGGLKTGKRLEVKEEEFGPLLQSCSDLAASLLDVAPHLLTLNLSLPQLLLRTMT